MDEKLLLKALKIAELLENGCSVKTVSSEGRYVIVRTQSAGVFAGIITSRNGQEVKMENARRLWYWDGAASLSQLAVEGVKKPASCKFPCEVPEITLLQAIEILVVSDVARKSIEAVPIWKQ